MLSQAHKLFSVELNTDLTEHIAQLINVAIQIFIIFKVQGSQADSITSIDQGYQSVVGGTMGQGLKDQPKCDQQSPINQDSSSFISSASKSINSKFSSSDTI